MTPSSRLCLALLCLSACALLLAGDVEAVWAQKAAYVVQSKADIDGDGRVDEVRIDGRGTITVHITGRTKDGAWTALAASGKVTGGSLLVDRKLDPKGRALILARSELRNGRGRRHEEMVILAWTPGKLTTLWRGTVGSTGRDGAKHVSIEISKYGLIKYASRQGVYRCDGLAAHLDAQRYDFGTGTFRNVRQAVRVARGPQVPVLHAKARPEDPRFASALGFWFRPVSASSMTQAATAAELVAPLALADKDASTAWVERAGGYGKGEFVTLKSSVGAVRIKALRLLLGHGAARNDFNRPKRLALLIGKSHKYWLEFDKDPKGEQWISLPEAVPSDCVSLIIDDVYPRSASKANRGRTAISEISIVSEEDLDPAVAGALLADRIAKGKGSADLGRLLNAWGSAAAPALAKAAQSSKDPRSRLRLRLALAQIPAEAPELVAGLTSSGLRPGQLRQLMRGLQGLQGEAVAALDSALASRDLSEQGRAMVVQALAGIKLPSAEEALVKALGKGSRKHRNALVHALVMRKGSAPALTAALALAEPGPRKADLYRASALACAKLPKEHPLREALAAALNKELSVGVGKLSDDAYESRYRLLQAAALIGGNALEASLVAGLASPAIHKDANSVALLRTRVAALAEMLAADSEEAPSPALVQVLKSALTHADPGVRLAVLHHIGSSKALLVGQATILEKDTWPEVRRSASASLAQHCNAALSTAALEVATRRDRDEEVARTSLSALLHCRKPGLLALLLAIIDDKDRPLDLRLFAARRAGEVSSGNSSAELLSRFRRARKGALTDQKSAKVASALTVSLADIGSAEAVDNLEDSALDPAVPELQAAAITALAKLCRPSSKPILRKLKRSSNPSVSLAARRASGSCH